MDHMIYGLRCKKKEMSRIRVAEWQSGRAEVKVLTKRHEKKDVKEKWAMT